MTFDRRNNRVQIANCKLQIETVSGCNPTPDRRFAVANTRSKIRRGEHPTPPRGMTLIELLVVIVILTTVVAAAIPIMAPSNVDRQLREASRTANTFHHRGPGPGDRIRPALRYRCSNGSAGAEHEPE